MPRAGGCVGWETEDLVFNEERVSI
jgi:hypothetical protein